MICGGEGGFGATCVVPDRLNTVYFGASGAYLSHGNAPNLQISCSAGGFGGDPLIGVPKICYFYIEPSKLPWEGCGKEGGQCDITGNQLVRFGEGDHWVYKAVAGKTGCNRSVFGDPSPDKPKICQVTRL